jgi:HAD superfamily hydrolase (TIGR01549 family)
MKSHKYKAIIFDFDGVISESVDVKTKAFSKIYSCYGKDIVEKVVSHHMSHGGMSRYKKFKYYHKEFLDRELNKEDLINISDKFSQLVLQKVIDAPYVPGALNFIKNNYKKYKLFISTGTPQNEINEILLKKRMKKYFVSIYGSPADKTDHIEDIIKKTAYKKDEVIFIGDADTDIVAAKISNVRIILREHNESSYSQKYKNMTKVNDLNNLSSYL